MSIETPKQSQTDQLSNDVLASGDVHSLVDPNRKIRFSEKHLTTPLRKILAFGAITATALGGGVGAMELITHSESVQIDSTDKNNSTLEPSANTLNTNTPSPSNIAPLETATPESNPVTSTYELKAEQSPQELAKNYIALGESWVNAACSSDSTDAYVANLSNGGLSITEFSQKLAHEQMVLRAPGLFGRDYASNPTLKGYADNLTELNAKTLELYIRTDLGHTSPFRETYIFDSLTSSSTNGNITTLVIQSHVDNNSQDSPKIVAYKPSGQKTTYSVSFIKTNNVEYVTHSEVTYPQ